MSGSIGSATQFQPSVTQQRQTQAPSAEVASATQNQKFQQLAQDIINARATAPVTESAPAPQGRGQIVNLLV